MGKRTSIYLTDDLIRRIERSRMTPVRLIEQGLAAIEQHAPRPPTTPASTPTTPTTPTGTTSGTTVTSTGTTGTTPPAPRLVTYTAIKRALNLRAGWPFTAADVASALDIPPHLARGRLSYLVQLGMAERAERTTGPGHPWRYRLVRMTPRQLCDEAQCAHERHLIPAQPAA